MGRLRQSWKQARANFPPYAPNDCVSVCLCTIPANRRWLRRHTDGPQTKRNQSAHFMFCIIIINQYRSVLHMLGAIKSCAVWRIWSRYSADNGNDVCKHARVHQLRARSRSYANFEWAAHIRECVCVCSCDGSRSLWLNFDGFCCCCCILYWTSREL